MGYSADRHRAVIPRFIFWLLAACLLAIVGMGCGSDKTANTDNDHIDIQIVPLTVGNEWLVRITSHNALNRGYGIDYDTIRVADGMTIEGEHWYYLSKNGQVDPESPLYRNRDDGLWIYDRVLDTAWLDLKYPAEVGDSYLWGTPLAGEWMIEVESVDASVTVPAGEFRAYTYTFDRGSDFVEMNVVPGIGSVQYRVWSNPERVDLRLSMELIDYSVSP